MTKKILKPKILILGGGRAGASLAFYFARQGYEIVSLVERNPKRLNYLKKKFKWDYLSSSLEESALREADLVLLVVKDDHLEQMANELALTDVVWKNKIVAHTSGALAASVLGALQKNGAKIAAVHPVYAFAVDPRENKGVNDIWFNMEGDDAALEFFEELFRHTQNKTFRVTLEQKKAIHLACVFYANFYVGLADICQTILNETLPREEDILTLLNPLLKSSIDTVMLHGPKDGLTGPVKRGDQETINSHIKYLELNHPELLQIYKNFTERLVPLADISGHEKNDLINLLTNR